MSKLAPGEEGKMEEVVRAAIPVGHMGEKADIALACVYLASSAGRQVHNFTSSAVLLISLGKFPGFHEP